MEYYGNILFVYDLNTVARIINFEIIVYMYWQTINTLPQIEARSSQWLEYLRSTYHTLSRANPFRVNFSSTQNSPIYQWLELYAGHESQLIVASIMNSLTVRNLRILICIYAELKSERLLLVISIFGGRGIIYYGSAYRQDENTLVFGHRQSCALFRRPEINELTRIRAVG